MGLTAAMTTYRTWEQVDDDLHFEFDTNPPDARSRAVLDVLCGVPDIDYHRLIKCFEKIGLFIPQAEKNLGFYLLDAHTEIQLFVGDWASPKGRTAVFLYLSPTLEDLPLDELRRVVADKLAHLVLDQEIYVDLDEEASKRDSESRLRKMHQWGF